MWQSMRPWVDWAMTNLTPASRTRPSGQAVHLRYEAAGLSLAESPVPWNADALVVEVLVRLPPLARHKGDFSLRVPGREAVVPESLRRDDADDARYRLTFRLAVPPGSGFAELLWKQKLLATVPIPVLSPAEFLANLTLHTPTLAVRVGGQSVAAQSFVAAQCRGLTAAAVLRSPTALVPLAEAGLRVVFRSDRTAAEYEVPVPLTGAQLAQREVLFTASPPKAPRQAGGYSATFLAGPRELGVLRATAVTGTRFTQSLRVSDMRFVVAEKAGLPRVARHAPLGAERLGPCFVVQSREPGMAALVTLRVLAVRPGREPSAVLEQQLLVTDGPTLFAPGLLDAADLAGVTAFELRQGRRVLAMLSVNPAPAALFDAEGGYKPPPDFTWTPTAEEELSERLLKLMGDGPK